MKENDLPPAPTAALVRFLAESLQASGGDTTRAEFVADFDEPLSPKTTSIGGGQLEALEPTAGPIPPKGDVRAACTAFLEETAKAGVAVRMVDVELTKRGEWTHVLAAETPQEHQEFRSQLAPFEKKVADVALRLAGNQWTRVSVRRQHDPKKPDQLGVFLDKTRNLQEAPPELKAALDDLEAAFARSGRLLGSATFSFEGDPGDHETTQDYYYRLKK